VSSPLELRSQIATQNMASPVGAELVREARGSFRGEEVKTSSEASKLADAAEEMGMTVAHRADKKTLGQREVRQGQGTDLAALARIADYYDKLPDMPREANLKSLVDSLEQMRDLLNKSGGGAGGPTKEDVLAALQKFDGDVTHQFAGLDVAREYFEATGASAEFMALLDEANGEFQKTDVARDVKAGFASAEVAARSAATLESDPATVREAYRTLIRESMNMGQLFDSLSKFDMMKNFKEIVETFMTAAGRDLASTGPDGDATHLHGLLTELSKLKKMQTVVDSAQQLLKTTDRLLQPGERGKNDPVELTSRMLNFSSKAAVSVGDAFALLGKLDKAALASQVAFANGLRGLHGELPDEIMPSSQARLQQATTILQMLDKLVEDEEAEYEEEDEERREEERRERERKEREREREQRR
jgi:type III secretion system YopN/LcrE/InvE/MxiC family regulator